MDEANHVGDLTDNREDERLHEIKEAAGYGPSDNVIFDLTGNVYDQSRALIGSLTQAGAKVPE